MPDLNRQLPLVVLVLGLFFFYAFLVRKGTIAGKAILGAGAVVSLISIGAWLFYWWPMVRMGLPLYLVLIYILPMGAASIWSVWTAYRSQLVADIASYTLGDTKVIVRSCSVQKIPDADALLLPTVTSLRMIEGIAGNIGFIAGGEVQKAARAAGPVGIGKIVSTPGGKLAVGRILHIAVADPTRAVEEGRLKKGMEQAAQQARKANAESIAIPIGALRGLTLKAAATATVSGVLRQRKAFAEIVFLALQPRDAQEIVEAVKREIAGLEEASNAHSPSGR